MDIVVVIECNVVQYEMCQLCDLFWIDEFDVLMFIELCIEMGMIGVDCCVCEIVVLLQFGCVGELFVWFCVLCDDDYLVNVGIVFEYVFGVVKYDYVDLCVRLVLFQGVDQWCCQQYVVDLVGVGDENVVWWCIECKGSGYGGY